MKLRKEIREGELLPTLGRFRCYGVAYASPYKRAWVCYPVPLNIIVHYSRELWFWLITWHPTKRERGELKKPFTFKG